MEKSRTLWLSVLSYCDVGCLQCLAAASVFFGKPLKAPKMLSLVEHAARTEALFVVPHMISSVGYNSRYVSWTKLLRAVAGNEADGRIGSFASSWCRVHNSGVLGMSTCMGMGSGMYGDGLERRCPTEAWVPATDWSPLRKTCAIALSNLQVDGFQRMRTFIKSSSGSIRSTAGASSNRNSEDNNRHVVNFWALVPKHAHTDPATTTPLSPAQQIEDISGYLRAGNRCGVAKILPQQSNQAAVGGQHVCVLTTGQARILLGRPELQLPGALADRMYVAEAREDEEESTSADRGCWVVVMEGGSPQ